MNPAEMVLLIIVVVVVGRLVRDRMRYQAQAHSHADTPEMLMLRDELRQVKERVAVLERVITDNHGSIDLDRQIERLRDR